jgi:DNA-binding response OmpR family regulator
MNKSMILPFPQRSQSMNDGLCDVLIVEDDGMQCLEMSGFLRRAQLTVESAPDGATAIARARILRPKVVLLDYNLPDMTGVQVAEQLRALLPNASILMMSGRIDGLSEKVLADLGVTVFVNKPVPLGPLRQAVVKLVRGSDGGSPRPQPGWLTAGVGGTRR